jgi:membrane protein DedA with SNARE-associated domain
MLWLLAKLDGGAIDWVSHLSDHVLDWVGRGGYPVLFGLLFACGLGLPLPEDIPLLGAGYAIYSGHLQLHLAAVCAWCGIIGGDCVLYHLGKRYGLEVTKVPLIGRHLTLSRILWVEQHFKRWGVWVVAIGRLFAGVRGAMVVCAGAIRFPFWKFLIADGLAAIVSGGLFIALGFFFGSQMNLLREHVDKGKRWVLLGVLVIAAGFGVWVWIRQHFHKPKLQSGPPPTDTATESSKPSAN